MSKILLSFIILIMISTSALAQSPFDPVVIHTNPLVIVDKSGKDCYDLNPYDIRCQTEKCCFEVITETLEGVPFVWEPDNIKQIVKESKGSYDDGKLIQEIILNWKTEKYVQSVIDLSNQLQLVMVGDYKNEGERRAAVNQLKLGHELYVKENHME